MHFSGLKFSNFSSSFFYYVFIYTLIFFYFFIYFLIYYLIKFIYYFDYAFKNFNLFFFAFYSFCTIKQFPILIKSNK